MYKNKNVENKKIRIVNGIKVQTKETEVSSFFNSLSAEAGTTGYMGGDTGKGGRTFIKIVNTNNSDIEVQKDANGHGFSLKAGGDAELDTLIDALDFILTTLKQQRVESKSSAGYKQSKVNKTPDEKKIVNEDSPVTSKQMGFLRALLTKNGYEIADADMTRLEAGELIEIFKDPNTNPEVPDKYRKFIKKVRK